MANQGRKRPSENPNLYSYGTNFLGSRAIFDQRLIYNELIFPDSEYPRLFKTWGRDRYYGTINTKGNAVIPNDSELRPLSFPDTETQFSLNFVADAWRDFCLRLRSLSNSIIIFRDSPWAAPTVKKAWFPVSEEYYQYMAQNIYPAFNGQFLAQAGRDRQISDIQGFLAMFDQFVDENLKSIGPLTISGLLEGSYLSPLVSGLMIEINDSDYDQDFLKSYVYKDSNFQLVQGIAEQYGFAIDKNIPWRLVADLRNPAMREYMYGVPIVGFDPDVPAPEDCDPTFTNPDLIPRAFGYSQIPGLEDVQRRINVYADGDELKPGYIQYQSLKEVTDQEKIFETLYENAYTETWNQDVSRLEEYLLNFYNTYAESIPVTTVPQPMLLGHRCAPRSQVISRSTITPEEFASYYGDRWRLKTFYVARQMERGVEKRRALHVRDIQEIMNIYNLSRTDNYARALRYTQEKFVGPRPAVSLTLDTVGDIMGPSSATTQRTNNDLSDSGRQNRMRGNLY